MPRDRQTPLFDEPEPPRKKRGTRAPDTLTDREMLALADWAEDKVPWLSREALDSFESLGSYVEEILEWWQGDGGVKANWARTVQNRIRKLERRRLARMARDGSQQARQALRDPIAWREAYDRRRAAVRATDVIDDEGDIAPGGGNVFQLGDRKK